MYCLARDCFGCREHISVSSKLRGVCLFIEAKGDETVRTKCGSAVKGPVYVGYRCKRRGYHLSPSALTRSLLH